MLEHPDRAALHNEIHARPPEPMSVPLAISHVVMLADAATRAASREHLAALLRSHHLPTPDPSTTHLRTEVGGVWLRWELHTEFVSLTFAKPVPRPTSEGPLTPPTAALESVPHDWLAALPGQALVRQHLWALPAGLEGTELVKQMLREDSLTGSVVADGGGEVFTDFAIHPDGCSRMILLASAMTRRRLGRLVQSLLEIETYRMAALLGLPAARQAGPVLAAAERELADLAEAIRTASANEEPVLLDRLTRLAGAVESEYARNHSRFSATRAYFELVDRRIHDLGESRTAGLQTIGEFMERRLTPARSTCAWAERRQDALSQRVSRVSNLLRTRVEIEQQESNQKLLATMNERQDLQLKLQSTVEGLSVAAITYYVVGLAYYLAKGAQALGWPLSPETTAAIAIPLVAGGVWWSLKRATRRLLSKS
jgi:uncharacterized membrane-anchored protein